jgi:hypothetical protein
VIPAATKQYLRALDEGGLDREHWGLGLAIRNVLGLWRDEAPLTRWFTERGFAHGDDMASLSSAPTGAGCTARPGAGATSVRCYATIGAGAGVVGWTVVAGTGPA